MTQKTTKQRLVSMLSDEQEQALYAYANWAGPKWKERLFADWMRSGSTWPGEWHHLQRVRNTLGPEWLADVILDMEIDLG